MFYAKFIRRATDTPTVANNTNKPLNFTIRGFETRAARQYAINAAWNAGGNGFPVTRKDVEGYYGRDFALYGTENKVDCGDEATVDQYRRWAELENESAA